jgi:hypothetical protein
MTRVAVLILCALLASSVALAEPTRPPLTPAAQSAQKKDRHDALKQWWVWSLVAALSAGTVVTSVIIATSPRGSSGGNSTSGTAGLTVRF